MSTSQYPITPRYVVSTVWLAIVLAACAPHEFPTDWNDMSDAPSGDLEFLVIDDGPAEAGTGDIPGCEVLAQEVPPGVEVDDDYRKWVERSPLPWRIRHVHSGIILVVIPPGACLGGGVAGPFLPGTRTRFRQRIVVPKPFYLGESEVTNAQLKVVVPEHRCGTVRGISLDVPGWPASRVSYDVASAACGSWGLRLPTEEEWEWAARSGQGNQWWSDHLVAVVQATANVLDTSSVAALGKSSTGTYLAGSDGSVGPSMAGGRKRNLWGVFDMLGNVAEWCASGTGATIGPDGEAAPTHPDAVPAGLRAFRGGSFLSELERSTPTAFGFAGPGFRGGLGFMTIVGFRVALDVPAVPAIDGPDAERTPR